nr:MAG TPA: hypothetical protein [Bacteriophage sp.]
MFFGAISLGSSDFLRYCLLAKRDKENPASKGDT